MTLQKVKDEWGEKRKRLRELGSWATLTLDLGCGIDLGKRIRISVELCGKDLNVNSPVHQGIEYKHG